MQCLQMISSFPYPLILSKALALQGFSTFQHMSCFCCKDSVEVVFFQLVDRMDLKDCWRKMLI